MAVDEAERHVIEAELDHHATLPAVPHSVYCSIVRVVRRNVDRIPALDEDDKEHLSFTHVVNLNKIWCKVVFHLFDLALLLRPYTLLRPVRDDVVIVFVWEQRWKVN